MASAQRDACFDADRPERAHARAGGHARGAGHASP